MTQQAFIDQLTTLGKQILPKDASLWLYGSRARGDAREDSDWDLLILLNKDTRDNSDFDAYSSPLIDYGYSHNQWVMPHIYTRKQWQETSFSPFAHNVEQDKIELI